jgi:surface polysaccharide O-acyltransferase-like enzyme
VLEPVGEGVRRNDLDWLRILVILMMIPFHTALVFTGPGFMFVKSGSHSPALWAFVGFTYSWSMPLLFFISGAGAWFSLRRRGGWRFLGERLRRLVPPSLLGLLVLVPLCAYLTHLQTASTPLTLGGFLARHYAQPAIRDVYWGHLWFLVSLLIIAVLAWPVLVLLQRDALAGVRARAAALLNAPGALLLAAVPFAAVAPLPAETGLPSFGWAMIGPQAVAYAAGFLVAGHPLMRGAVARSLLPALGVAIIVSGVSLWIPIYARRDVFAHLAFYLGRWGWVLAAVGLAQRYLRRGGPALRYLCRAGLPVYLLHVPVATALAFFIVARPWPIVWQFVVIVIGTAAGSLLIYEALIRRIRPMRWLFGLRR